MQRNQVPCLIKMWSSSSKNRSSLTKTWLRGLVSSRSRAAGVTVPKYACFHPMEARKQGQYSIHMGAHHFILGRHSVSLSACLKTPIRLIYLSFTTKQTLEKWCLLYALTQPPSLQLTLLHVITFTQSKMGTLARLHLYFGFSGWYVGAIIICLQIVLAKNYSHTVPNWSITKSNLLRKRRGGSVQDIRTISSLPVFSTSKQINCRSSPCATKGLVRRKYSSSAWRPWDPSLLRDGMAAFWSNG